MFNPAEPLDVLEWVIDKVDLVLIMSVNPGFGGQKFIPYTLDKVRNLANRRRERGLTFPIEIDGGVTRDNAGDVVRAGVEWLVAGSSVFGNGSPSVNVTENFNGLREQARAAEMVRV